MTHLHEHPEITSFRRERNLLAIAAVVCFITFAAIMLTPWVIWWIGFWTTGEATLICFLAGPLAAAAVYSGEVFFSRAKTINITVRVMQEAERTMRKRMK